VNQVYGIGETAVFSCQATGEPVPLIEWYFNNTKVNVTNSTKYIASSPVSADSSDSHSTLIILNVTPLDMGTYLCYATNVAGNVTSSGQLIISGKQCLLLCYTLMIALYVYLLPSFLLLYAFHFLSTCISV